MTITVFVQRPSLYSPLGEHPAYTIIANLGLNDGSISLHRIDKVVLTPRDSDPEEENALVLQAIGEGFIRMSKRLEKTL